MSLQKLPLLDAFKWRHSVRTFTNEFSPEQEKIVQEIVKKANEWKTPFNTEGKIGHTNRKIGSYGFVKGASGSILDLIPKNYLNNKELKNKAIIDASFKAQIAVMELSRYKIGTVWLGGSFNSKQSSLDFPECKTICCIPYGIENPNIHMQARVLKFMVKPDKRKPFEQLFYNVDAKRPYTEETSKDLLPMFTALRSGPSARNQQGWRFCVDGKEMHIYYNKKLLLASADIGIALGNLALLVKENNIEPKFTTKNNIPPSYLGGDYICSCIIRE
ncbi:nitroreductase Nfs [Histomonas meleagridis]|uniref:nitroreductase Nfs n=1 Tax=Histomonas meleagridis TaxID=135588 RepID=UPI0035599983|nr:nitroreductase Nfs [Histomonas meleagridis]KAH0802339.1 nitroreductase Nfs [Histomonas meleagridis]